MTLVSMVLATWAAWRERQWIDRRITWQLILTGIVGMPVGLLLLARASDLVLQVLMAIAILAALIIVMLRVQVSSGPLMVGTTGVLSGALLTSTGMNGPPLVLALSAANPSPQVFRGTLQAIFSAHDVVAVVGFILVSQFSLTAAGLAAMGVVLSPVGWLLGDRIFRRIPAEIFHWVISVGLLLSAIMLVVAQL